MKKLFFLLLLVYSSIFTYAQEKDLQLWTGPVFRYYITGRLRIEFEQQFRFDENISKYDLSFSEFGIRYTVFRYLDLKAVYRYSFIPGGVTGSAINDYDKSRITIDGATGTEIFKTGLKIGYRLRYQDSWENTSLISSHYIRNRIDLDYNLSKLADPYFEFENYYRLDNRNESRQNRLTWGLKWRITDKLDIDSYYRYQYEMNVNNPETDNIIGLGLIYTFN